MEMIRAVGALFAIAFGLWGLPGVWEHWSRERRLAARIERQGKVLDRVDISGVRRTLERDNARAAVDLAVLRLVRLPKHVVGNTVISFGLYLLFVTSPKRISDYFGLRPGEFEWGDVVFAAVAVTIMLYATTSLQVLTWARRLVRRDRVILIKLGFPAGYDTYPISYLRWIRLLVRRVVPVQYFWRKLRDRKFKPIRAEVSKAEATKTGTEQAEGRELETQNEQA
jgi:hypothetical protein